MYYCNDCKTLFDDPNHKYMNHSELDGNWNERYAVCPNCGSEDFETARQCEHCGEWLDKYNRSKIFPEYCIVCEDELNYAMDKSINILTKEGLTDYRQAVEMVEKWVEAHW